jgi:hypothetical protein
MGDGFVANNGTKVQRCVVFHCFHRFSAAVHNRQCLFGENEERCNQQSRSSTPRACESRRLSVPCKQAYLTHARFVIVRHSLTRREKAKVDS